jgi:hypothetical protein
LLSACDNELEVFAPYKETPVIYCILDGGSDTQYVRISKTYQIKGNSYDGAADSTLGYYNENLNVTLTQVSSGISTGLQRIRMQKEPGVFSSRNDVYYTSGTFNILPGNDYSLQVNIPTTGKTYQTTIKAIDPPTEIMFTGNSKIDFNYNNLTVTVGRLNSIYACYVRLNYEECDTNTGTTCTRKYIDYYVLRNQLIDSRKPFERINITMRGTEWVSYLRHELAAASGKTFRHLSTDIYWVGGGKEFEEAYYQSQPSLFFVPKTTNTSNIPDALGFAGAIYTSRLLNVTLDPSVVNLLRTIPGMII